ncbi:DUF3473 domain-containing protein [candidate division KSB1 bacterium]|nr:DUF3473 domain-containing protein [candidate division KSB1 bacterium]
MSKITNIFSIDLEDWYMGNECIKVHQAQQFEQRIDYSTSKLLDMLAEFSVQATFFVLGFLAEKNKRLIRKIHAAGHEIATHGYSHELVYNQSHDIFREELKRSILGCEDIIGEAILGHRASNWTITDKSLWALDILKESGIEYDSSIFPTKNYLYGIPGAPRYKFVFDNGLIEYPPSVAEVVGQRIPFSGGFYLRLFPYRFIKWAIEQINSEGQPAVIYLHPWELDTEQPRRLPVPLKNRIIHYTNLNSTERKIRQLLKDFSFSSFTGQFQLTQSAADLKKVEQLQHA